MRFKKYSQVLTLFFLILGLSLLYSASHTHFSLQTAFSLTDLFSDDVETVEEVPTPEPEAISPVQAEPTVDDFGIETDGARIRTDQVRRGETFADLLTAHGVAYPQVLAVADAAEPVYDVRHLRAGKPYRIYEDEASGEPHHFVYQMNAVEYVVFDLQDPENVHRGERPISIERREAHGTIQRSLYETLADVEAPSSLAFELSEVFAWQIDFYRVQPGDNFTVIYEEKQVDGEVIGIENIVAARFDHMGRDFFGFYFEQDGRGEYFDEKGESLRKQLLKAPLQYSRISSGFSRSRYHPILKEYRAHLGTDYAAPRGTPVRAVGDGVVLEAQYSRGNGNYVKIRHNGTYTTGYLHLNRIAGEVRPGAHVEQGQVIGAVGSTGLATGPHLCYRFWKNGQQVDHRQLEMPPSEPVDTENLLAFQRLAETLLPHLHPEGTLLAENLEEQLRATAAAGSSTR